MRLGSLLLIGGFLLCVSIVWATLGFLMMGVGLICLLIEEKRRKRSQRPAPPTLEATDQSEPRPSPESAPAPIASGVPTNSMDNSFDEDKWKSLVETDPDLSRLAGILSPYGQKYVDELARAYLAFNDKGHLPTIIKSIVASARKDAGKDVTSELTVISNPIPETVTTRTRRMGEYRVRALLAVQGVVGQSPASATADIRKDIDRASSSLAKDQDAADRSRPEPKNAAATRLAKPTTEIARPVYIDAPDNLSALLTGLDLRAKG